MIKVNQDGSIEAATPAEAVEIARLLAVNRAANNAIAEKPAVRAATKAVHVSASLTSEARAEIAGSVSDWVIPCAVRFLTAIQSAGAAGIDKAVAMKAMEIETAQAFGGRIAAVKKLLERCGFASYQVYDTVQNPQGKVWKGKPKLNEAIALIRPMGLL